MRAGHHAQRIGDPVHAQRFQVIAPVVGGGGLIAGIAAAVAALNAERIRALRQRQRVGG